MTAVAPPSTLAQCQQAAEQVGTGVAAALRAVDCAASEVTATAFGRLFAPGGQLAYVLTALLTLYVAFFAIQLLTGRGGLGVRSLTPRMITVGLVLTFATSWVAYQSVVWNLAIGAPDWLATQLTGDDGSATETFAQKIDIVFIAIQEASGPQRDFGAFSPEGLMWLGALLFMLGTVGLLVTAKVALALLVALGPLFVVMALFNGTRGMFAGWLKGVVMLALAPMFAVLGGGLMLELAVPILANLVAMPGQVDPQSAMAFFMIGAVHVALMILVLKVATTMVSGWTVFGLVAADESPRDQPAIAPQAAAPVAASVAQAQQATAAAQAARRIDVSAQPVAAAANDAGAGTGVAATSGSRTTQVFATSNGGTQVQPISNRPSRASGIGSRFKTANAPASARSTEKVK
ncbi:type IV secretion system protein [Erythrobacter sp. W53]|uniref:type IV secretion system protein n=1 Tax=Erythrobacter sp. W53 TaxID=3425947 RepID=UPI003D7685B9